MTISTRQMKNFTCPTSTAASMQSRGTSNCWGEGNRMADNFRIEHDSMGEMKVPADALYGAQTQRAVENFPISSQRLQRPFIRTLGLIKAAAARANAELGYVDIEIAKKIEAAAHRVAA